MKQVFSFILALVLLFSLVACGEKAPETEENTTTSTPSQASTTTVEEGTTTTTTKKKTGKKTDAVTKSSQTTTSTTAAKPDYTVKEDLYFSYSAPIIKTDYETGEPYYAMLYLGLEFYPNGGEMLEGTFTQPVMVPSESTHNLLIPKENYPKAVEYAVNYMRMDASGEENPTITWAEVFEMIRKNDAYPIIKHNGVEYVEFFPPMGGFEYPVYSYTINDTNGNVSFSLLPGFSAEDAEYELLSVQLKPNKKQLSATYKMNGKATTIEMTCVTR